jgi:hypothetical protein
MDVIVSSLVLWLLFFSEGNRLGMKRLWLPVLASLAVGVSLASRFFFICARFILIEPRSSQPLPHDGSN